MQWRVGVRRRATGRLERALAARSLGRLGVEGWTPYFAATRTDAKLAGLFDAGRPRHVANRTGLAPIPAVSRNGSKIRCASQ